MKCFEIMTLLVLFRSKIAGGGDRLIFKIEDYGFAPKLSRVQQRRYVCVQ